MSILNSGKSFSICRYARLRARSTVSVKVLFALFIIYTGYYTIQILLNLYWQFISKKLQPVHIPIKVAPVEHGIKRIFMFNEDEINIDNHKEWEKQLSWFKPKMINGNDTSCTASSICRVNEFSFRLTTGTANVVGPSICFNGSYVMRTRMDNVGRGMNVVVLDGKKRKLVNHYIFDLYEKHTTEFKEFLKSLKKEHIIMIATFDDVTKKLDSESRRFLTHLGSKHAAELSFRDNWAFVGGKNVSQTMLFEKVSKRKKHVHGKLRKWPKPVIIEGCLALW